MYSKSLSFKSSSDIQVIRDIDDILCRGYRPSENDIKQFKQRGINTIIDFSFETFKDSSPDTEKKLAEKYGIKYYNIPFLDTTNPEDDKIEKFFRFRPKALPQSYRGTLRAVFFQTDRRS